VKGGKIEINTSVSQGAGNRQALGETSAASVSAPYPLDAFATRTDTALLISALFLQRFFLPFGDTFLA
jgi:hypothetical protein